MANVNESIGRLILTWINHFGFAKKVGSLSDLADGDVFVSLIKIWLKNEGHEDDVLAQACIEDVEDRYELIEMVLASVLITSGINYDLAKKAHHFELAKIAFILLINGVTKDIPAFVAASEKLETSQYELTNTFFFILEKEKMSFPPASIRPYEEFLCTAVLPAPVTPNQDKHSPMLRARESMNSSNRRSGIAANILMSPLKGLVLSSPRNKSTARNEEIFHNEKRRLEREIHAKELHIYELTDQLRDREDKQQRLEHQLEELKRKMVEMNGYREKAYDYESLLEKVRAFEKENAMLSDKCKQFSIDSDELNSLRKNFEKQQSELNSLSEQLSCLEKKDLANEIELLRLKRIESELNYLKEVKTEKEKKILQLIQEKGNLETQLLTANENMVQVRSRFTEQIEDLSGENALTHNKLNSVYAQMNNLKQELEDKIKSLEGELFDQRLKYKSLEQSYAGLQDVFNEAKRNFTAEAAGLGSIIENMKNQNNTLTIDNSELNKKLEAQTRNLAIEKERAAAAQDALKQELEARKKELAERLKDIETLKWDAENRESEFKREASALRNEMADQASQIRALQTEIANKESLLAQRAEELAKAAADGHALEDSLEERGREVESLSAQIEAKERELAEAVEEKMRLSSELEGARAQIRERLAEIESLDAQIGEKDRELARFGEESRNLTSEIESLSQNLATTRQTLAEETAAMNGEIEAKAAQLAALRESFETTKADLEAQIEAKVAEMNGLRADFDEERAGLRGQMETTAAEFAEYRAGAEQQQAQLQAAIESKTAEFEALAASAEEEKSRLEGEIETKIAELAQLRGEFESAKAVFEAQMEAKNTELASLGACSQEEKTALLAEIESKSSEMAAIRAAAETETARMQAEIGSRSAELAELRQSAEQEQARLQAEIESLQTVQAGHVSQIGGLELQVQSLQSELAAASESTTKVGSEKLALGIMLEDKSAEIDALRRESEARQAELANELVAAKHQLNERIGELRVSANELEARDAELKVKTEENVKYVNEIVALRKDLIDKTAKAAEMEKSFTQEIGRLKKISETRDHTLDNKIKECESLKFNMEELDAKSRDFELTIGERDKEIKRLVRSCDELKADFEAKNKLLQTHINTFEQRFKDIQKDAQAEKEEAAKTQKRLRDDVNAKQAELDSLKLKLRHAEEKEKFHVSQLEDANERLNGAAKKANERERLLEAEYENMKQMNMKLKMERAEFEARCKELEKEAQSFKEYGSQLDHHYQKKKAHFETIANDNVQLKAQIAQFDKRLKHMMEEMVFLKEKIKTVNFENQTLKSQKEDLAKRLSEMPLMSRDRDRSREDLLGEFSSRQDAKFAASMGTPPKSKFYDDSYVKYSSPGLRTRNSASAFSAASDDFRRFSMDSQARTVAASAAAAQNSSRLTNGASIPSLNRFNAISENEFEESSLNAKSFQQQEEPALHRLSVIQQRNQQAKPHLKSSYPLEMAMSFSENQIRSGGELLTDDKENVRHSLVNSKPYVKRPMADAAETHSPTKRTVSHSSSSNILRQSNL